MNYFKLLTLSFCLVFITFAKAEEIVEQAYASRIEIIPFQSLNLTDEQILKGDKSAGPVTLAGELRYPLHSSLKKLPLVVIVHGSGGINPANESWAYQLNAQGIATFGIDSFSGRGLMSVSSDQAKLARLAGTIDAFRAVEMLQKHPNIDPNKIALIGSSRGGTAVIYTSMKRLQQLWSPNFKALATYPFYPSCFDELDRDEEITMPIHAFHGELDDYASKEQCKNWLARLSAKGALVTGVEYKDAAHSFDNSSGAKTPTVSKGAQSAQNCHIVERNGLLINVNTNLPFTYQDACVHLDPKTGFNKEATLQSHQWVIEDLKRIFFQGN